MEKMFYTQKLNMHQLFLKTVFFYFVCQVKVETALFRLKKEGKSKNLLVDWVVLRKWLSLDFNGMT
jgi:hypothetical protein